MVSSARTAIARVVETTRRMLVNATTREHQCCSATLPHSLGSSRLRTHLVNKLGPRSTSGAATAKIRNAARTTANASRREWNAPSYANVQAAKTATASEPAPLHIAKTSLHSLRRLCSTKTRSRRLWTVQCLTLKCSSRQPSQPDRWYRRRRPGALSLPIALASMHSFVSKSFARVKYSLYNGDRGVSAGESQRNQKQPLRHQLSLHRQTSH
mmetsp:Transcript_40115/g.66568  ORF Transcript_40115/g.66568 Transcript_40115/m.66568 type:complete len:212 (+) Transcript_40115:238-873(+)